MLAYTVSVDEAKDYFWQEQKKDNPILWKFLPAKMS